MFRVSIYGGKYADSLKFEMKQPSINDYIAIHHKLYKRLVGTFGSHSLLNVKININLINGINTQSVPRSKHTPSLLYKPVS